MNILRFVRYHTEFGYCYRIAEPNSFLEELAFFLSTEIEGFGSVRLKRSINRLEREDDSTSGNMITVEKRGSNLYLSYLYDNSEDSFLSGLEISKQDLFKLMDTWEKLVEEEPEEIVLIRDNGKFDLIGKNAS